MGSDEDMAVGFQPVLSSNGQRTAEPSGAVRALKRVDLRRAVRNGPASEWSNDVGRAVSASAGWAVYRPDQFGDWIFIHRATGLQAPALYTKTLKGAAPVLAALEGCGRFVSAKRPGDSEPKFALLSMRSEISAALRACDTSGLDEAWDYYLRPKAPEPPAPPPQGVNATGAEAFPDNHLNEGD